MATILLVEDNQMVRTTIRRALEFSGHTVTEATNGLDAEVLVDTTPIDVLLTDLIMPVRDGLELVQSVREKHPTLPIIAMSGGGRTKAFTLLDVAQEFGASAVLKKPFRRGALVAAIDALVGKPKPGVETRPAATPGSTVLSE